MVNTYVPSLESIPRQSGKLFTDLTKSVASLRASNDFSTKGVSKSLLPQVIKTYTGIQCQIDVKSGVGIRCFPPVLTPQHILYTEEIDIVNVSGPSLSSLRGNILKGKVDIQNSKVSGVFSDIVCGLTLDTNMFRPKAFTDEEIAAKILHEVGHLFTFFQFSTTMISGAIICNSIARNVMSSNNYSERNMVFIKGLSILGVDESTEVMELIENPKPGLEVMLLSLYSRQLKTGSTSSWYDYRNIEQLADTFAVKHGAAFELASATHKYNLKYKQYNSSSFFVNVISETAIFFSRMATEPVQFTKILFTYPTRQIYDEPKDRLIFIKQQLIDDLKQVPRTNKKLLESISEQISKIDEIIKTVDNKNDVVTFFHTYVSSSGKSNKELVKEQKRLEQMLNNDLFYNSVQIRFNSLRKE